jgi:hypothetical protein
VLDREERLQEAVEGFTPEARLAALLRVLMAPPEQRTEAIGRLYEMIDAGVMAELLIDLEEDRLVALEVADAPRVSPPTDQR